MRELVVTKYGSEDVSKATISRMATYLRCLTYLAAGRVDTFVAGIGFADRGEC